MSLGEASPTQELVARWVPFAIIFATVIGGSIIEWILRGFYRRAKRRDWTVLTALLEAIRGVVLLWSAALGIFAALLFFPFRGEEGLVANRALVVLVIWSATIIAARLMVRLVKNYIVSHQHAGKTASLFMTLTAIGVYAIGAIVVLK